MKDKKLDKKQICALVVAIGAVACIIIYMMVFTKYKDKTDELKKSNKELAKEVEDIKFYWDNMDTYIKDKANIKIGIEEMTADYPGDARDEDVIMMAVGMNQVSTINFKKVNVALADNLYIIPQETVAGMGEEEWQSEIMFNGKKASYECTTDFVNLKVALAKVYESPYRIGINAVSLQKDKDDNNFVKGTIDISYYSLLGMNKEYKYPDMSEYVPGDVTTDLFGIKNMTAGEWGMGPAAIQQGEGEEGEGEAAEN